jgi:uncharacterized protein involved in exopolysaccharide biosynthesis
MAQLGGFEEGSAEQTFLQDVTRKLGRRKLFIVGATALLFAVLAAVIQVLPRTYEGTATVEVESQTPHAVAVRDVLGDPAFTDETMGTELAILNSRELLSRVVDQLKLTADPEFNPNLKPGLLDGASPALVSLFSRWAPELVRSLWPDDKAAPTREQVYADVLDGLRKHLSMAPVSHSRVMQISAYSHDRQKAALIANAVVDSYIAVHLEQKAAVSGEAHRFIEKQLGELREAANSAAQAVEDYRNQNGLIAGEKNTLLQEELTQASNQLLEARGKLATLNTQWQAIKSGNPENAAAVIADPTITRLREQESTLDMQLANMSRRYGPDSSFLGPLKAQLGAVRASITAEARRQVPSLQYAVNAQQANVDALVARLSDLIGRVRKMELARAHLATLSDESRAAHDIYVNFLSRAKETDRDVQWTATPAANVRIISQAAGGADPLLRRRLRHRLGGGGPEEGRPQHAPDRGAVRGGPARPDPAADRADGGDLPRRHRAVVEPAGLRRRDGGLLLEEPDDHVHPAQRGQDDAGAGAGRGGRQPRAPGTPDRRRHALGADEAGAGGRARHRPWGRAARRAQPARRAAPVADRGDDAAGRAGPGQPDAAPVPADPGGHAAPTGA